MMFFCLTQALKCIYQKGEGKKKKSTSESILKPREGWDSGSSPPTLNKGQAENPSPTFIHFLNES